MDGGSRRWRERLAAVWRAAALLGLNTLLVLLLVNLVAIAALSFTRRPAGPLRYGLEKLARVYPGRGDAEIEALLRETWSRRYLYAPFVQHREGATQGRFVSVDAHGFRHSADQGPWPPAAESFNIFVFGGSTTFGYGVADGETIASRLQQALGPSFCGAAPRVYNFGRGNYYGEQERVLFEGLLTAGTVPEVALFIDGLNEWKEAPKFTARLEYLLRESDGALALRALKTLPVVELLRRLRPADGDAEPSAAGEDERRLAEAAVRRWLGGKRLIEAAAAEFEVVPLFVWQPVPTWGYDLEHHLFAVESAASLARHGPLRRGYELMAAHRVSGPRLEAAGNFLWLADLQRGRGEPLYVDAAHYTAAFSAEIAQRIAGFMADAVPCDEAG